MLSGLALLLGATGVLAGVTGTWSPCGFSMIDSLAAGSRQERRGTTLVAVATFTMGALAGGAALFGGLAALGALLDAGGSAPATVAAVAIAAAAALAELRGVRIRPQVRRQVPEPWRRTLPLPLASALYGVLLGLGFATFILTLAVGALAAICLALGDPALGLVVGAGFGLGRALPVAVLAPLADTPLGIRAVELMAERPASLRGLRAADGLALAACALAIATGVSVAATTVARPATDPSVAGDFLAWQQPGVGGFVRHAGVDRRLPGSDPALGGAYVAWHRGDLVTVARVDTLAPVLQRHVRGVEKLAVSSRWLAWRAHSARGDRIGAARLGPGAPARTVASVRPGSQLGRPDLSGDRLVYHVVGRRGSSLRIVNLRTGRRSTLARSPVAQLLNPSLAGKSLVYVLIGSCGQQLRVRTSGHARILLRGRSLASTDAGFEPGHTPQGSGTGPCPHRAATHTMFWTTAVGRRFAYLTLVRPAAGSGSASLVRVAR